MGKNSRKKPNKKFKKYQKRSDGEVRGNPSPKVIKKRISQPSFRKKKPNEKFDTSGFKKNRAEKKRAKHKQHIVDFASDHTKQAEILLPESDGLLEADPGETTSQYTQEEIVKNVDITTATKHFHLELMRFGPYSAKYSRNGRHLLLAGKQGHLAAIDWLTKNLSCEFNAMESIADVTWLHNQTMFAAAQKEWVYIYDHQGIEIHCLKKLHRVTKMDFLPYHFLLNTANELGFLSWLDVSIGEMVAQYYTNLGNIRLLAHNPYNAISCCGGSDGTVSMWSPNYRKPLAKLLCHAASLTALAFDPSGTYMATAATNKEVNIWDCRKLLGPLHSYKVRHAASHLSLSQKRMLAISMGNVVNIYREFSVDERQKPYMVHKVNFPVSSVNFCPYEDVLGIGYERGFVSMIVPGSGEPNYDAFEANPFQTVKQRQEAEVKSLLDKIQPEFITLEPYTISKVDRVSLKKKMEAKRELMMLKTKNTRMFHIKKGKKKKNKKEWYTDLANKIREKEKRNVLIENDD